MAGGRQERIGRPDDMRRAAPDKAGTPVEAPERSDGLRHAAAGLEGSDAHLPDRVPEATPLHPSTVTDRTRVGPGESVSVAVDLGDRRIIKKKNTLPYKDSQKHN